MKMPANEGGDFTPPPAGTFLAVSYRLIDLGTQEVTFQGQTKHQHKIMISWELPEEKMQDGQPFSVHRRYTYSSSEKATLRNDLQAWRGRAFQDSDFGGPNAFDIKNILGKGCMLGIVHSVRDGKTYANISNVLALPKGTKAPPPVNKIVYLSLEPGAFDRAAFDGLSDGLKGVIMKSPEWAELNKPKDQSFGDPEQRGVYADPDLDDSIPF